MTLGSVKSLAAEVALLRIDPEREPARARNVFSSHPARAKWTADHGYRRLLGGGSD
jgi:hypothetical protein